MFYCCRAVVPSMREAGYGRVVNVVSSVMLKQSTAGFGLYAACKEAVRTITDLLRCRSIPTTCGNGQPMAG